jgi:molybdopterin-binding protein
MLLFATYDSIFTAVTNCYFVGLSCLGKINSAGMRLLKRSVLPSDLDYSLISRFLTLWCLYDIFSLNSYGGGAIMKISARNVLKGRIKTVKHGSVNSEITIGLPGGIQVVSIITKKSAQNMRLSKGKEVYAVIKASNVMVATD